MIDDRAEKAVSFDKGELDNAMLLRCLHRLQSAHNPRLHIFLNPDTSRWIFVHDWSLSEWEYRRACAFCSHLNATR